MSKIIREVVQTSKTSEVSPSKSSWTAKFIPEYRQGRGPKAKCLVSGTPIEGMPVWRVFISRTGDSPRYILDDVWNGFEFIEDIIDKCEDADANVEGYQMMCGVRMVIEFRCKVPDPLKAAVLAPNNDDSPAWHIVKHGIATPPYGTMLWHDRLDFLCEHIKAADVFVHIYDRDGNLLDILSEHWGGRTADGHFAEGGAHPTEEDKERLLRAINDALIPYRGYDNWASYDFK